MKKILVKLQENVLLYIATVGIALGNMAVAQAVVQHVLNLGDKDKRVNNFKVSELESCCFV